MNLNSCLERIRYNGRKDVSEKTLRELQQAFLLAVPFENFDIHLGRHIDIAPEAVYRKVVENGRGGFCFELNSLFHDLLLELGFDVHFLAARMMQNGQPGTVMGHMVLRVNVDGHSWLADVGNGKSFRRPLDLDGSNEDWAEGIGYKVAPNGDQLAVLETGSAGEWGARFIFDPESRQREEFRAVCEWTQSSPESHFTQRQLCTLALPNGRVVLMDGKLSVTNNGDVEERDIAADEFERCLHEQFGLHLHPE